MPELKRRPRQKIALIVVLTAGLITLFAVFGLGINSSPAQIQTAKAEYFPTADGNWMIQNMIPLTKNLYGVSCAPINPNSGFCFGVGENGIVVKMILLQNAYVKWIPQSSFTTKTLRGITCLNGTSCYVVGGNNSSNSGEIWAYDGTNWSLELGNVGTLNAIGCNGNNCFALGVNGLIIQKTANIWGTVNSATSNTLNSFSCYSANLCFAVGAGGTIQSYDGNSWNSATSGTNLNLNGVSCYDSPARVCIAVGNNGTILKYDGTTWTPQNSGISSNLNGVYCNYYNCFAPGDSGILLRYFQSNWGAIPSNNSINLRVNI